MVTTTNPESVATLPLSSVIVHIVLYSEHSVQSVPVGRGITDVFVVNFWSESVVTTTNPESVATTPFSSVKVHVLLYSVQSAHPVEVGRAMMEVMVVNFLSASVVTKTRPESVATAPLLSVIIHVVVYSVQSVQTKAEGIGRGMMDVLVVNFWSLSVVTSTTPESVATAPFSSVTDQVLVYSVQSEHVEGEGRGSVPVEVVNFPSESVVTTTSPDSVTVAPLLSVVDQVVEYLVQPTQPAEIGRGYTLVEVTSLLSVLVVTNTTPESVTLLP